MKSTSQISAVDSTIGFGRDLGGEGRFDPCRVAIGCDYEGSSMSKAEPALILVRLISHNQIFQVALLAKNRDPLGTLIFPHINNPLRLLCVSVASLNRPRRVRNCAEWNGVAIPHRLPTVDSITCDSWTDFWITPRLSVIENAIAGQ